MTDVTPSIEEFLEAHPAWRNPTPERLVALLGFEPGSERLKLFERAKLMRSVAEQVQRSGFLEIPDFCLVANDRIDTAGNDGCLVLEGAIFIGGSVIPGDDVLIALGRTVSDPTPKVRVLDWTGPDETRWRTICSLDEFLERLARLEK